MPDLYLLDTSAIVAFTDQEEGADEVERLLMRLAKTSAGLKPARLA